MENALLNFRNSMEFLKKHSDEYPYACRTDRSFPDPGEAKKKTRLDFVCASILKQREWRFRTKAERQRFKQYYVTKDNKQ